MGRTILIVILYVLPLFVCILLKKYEKRSVNKSKFILFRIVAVIITLVCLFSLNSMYGQSIISKDDLYIIVILPCVSYVLDMFGISKG